MAYVLLDTLTVTTDPLASLASNGVSYTHANVKFTNPSETEAEFRVISSEPLLISNVTSVPSGENGEITVFPISPGTSKKIYLERSEADVWVGQGYVLISTPTSSLSVTAGSTSAEVTFPTPVADANYVVAIEEYGGASGREHGIVAIKDGFGTAIFTGLKKFQKYKIGFGVMYPQSILEQFSGTLDEDGGVLLHSLEFTTSQAAEMVLTGPFASHMGLDWSASVDGQGSLYRIVNRVGESDDVLVESSTETNAIIQDLQPRSEYRIVLQRNELGGNWSDQNEVAATTLTSSLSLGSVASKTLQLNWTSMYPGASFEIMYSAGSGSPTGSGQTQELSTVVSNLSAGVDYELNLVVYELGQAVGLARLGMTTKEAGLFSASNFNLKLAAIALLIVFLVTFLIMKGS